MINPVVCHDLPACLKYTVFFNKDFSFILLVSGFFLNS